MDRISRTVYGNAAKQLLEKAFFTCAEVKLCQFLLHKADLNIYVDIAGKSLPYYGSCGQEAFEWETHVRPDRIDKLIRQASIYKASPWLGFCYRIRDIKYRDSFLDTVSIADNVFGLRMISIKDYTQSMRERSPSSGEVEIPRNSVLSLTMDPGFI